MMLFQQNLIIVLSTWVIQVGGKLGCNWWPYLCNCVIMSSLHHLYHHGIMSSCQLLVSFGCFWQLLSICCNICQFMTTFSKVWRRMPTIRDFTMFDIFFATFGNFCDAVVLSSCHPVILSYTHLSVLSFCPFVIFTACQVANFWASQLVSFSLTHFRACELVWHIRGMISFGGFLAECLPCYSRKVKF